MFAVSRAVLSHPSEAEDPIVTDWVSRTVTAGGTVSTSFRSAVDTFVKGCKSDGIWSTMATSGLILPFASEAFTGAFVPLIAPAGSTLTPSNYVAGDYGQRSGLNGNPSSNRSVTTNISPSAVFSASSIQVSIYQRQIRAASGIKLAFSAEGSSRRITVERGNNYDRIDVFNDADGLHSTTGNPTGLLTCNYDGTTSRIFTDGVQRSSKAVAVGLLPTGSINLFSLNNTFHYDSSITSYFYIGRALTPAQEALHSARVLALQSALNRNPGEDIVASDWASALSSAGGTTTETARLAISDFAAGCKTDNIWNKLQTGVILPFASSGFAGFLTPLAPIGSRSLTNNNFVSGDYSSSGLDCGAANSTKFISTNFPPSSVFTSASVQISCYQNIVRTADLQVLVSSEVDGSNRILILRQNGDRFDMFNDSTGLLSVSGSPPGLITCNYDGTTSRIFTNGTQQGSKAVSSTTFPSNNVTIFRLGSGAALFGRSRTTYLYLGSVLTPSEEALHYNRVQALQTALGRQV